MMLLLAISLALSPPTVPTLSADETTQLSERQPVVRAASDSVLAVIDMAATPAQVIDAVLDVQARRDEVDSIEKVTIYAQSATQQSVRYDLSILGFDASMSLIYDIDRAQNFVKYYEDPSQESDVSGAGSYHAVALPNGATRLYYRVNVPDEGAAWIKKALLEKNLPEQIQGIRARAEKR